MKIIIDKEHQLRNIHEDPAGIACVAFDAPANTYRFGIAGKLKATDPLYAEATPENLARDDVTFIDTDTFLRAFTDEDTLLRFYDAVRISTCEIAPDAFHGAALNASPATLRGYATQYELAARILEEFLAR